MTARKKIRRSQTRSAALKQLVAPSSDFDKAVNRVKESKEAVDAANAILETWENQVLELERQMKEACRQVNDTRDVLSARRSKLDRELNELRSVSYNMNQREKWNELCAGTAQCEKACR